MERGVHSIGNFVSVPVVMGNLPEDELFPAEIEQVHALCTMRSWSHVNQIMTHMTGPNMAG